MTTVHLPSDEVIDHPSRLFLIIPPSYLRNIESCRNALSVRHLDRRQQLICSFVILQNSSTSSPSSL